MWMALGGGGGGSILLAEGIASMKAQRQELT